MNPRRDLMDRLIGTAIKLVPIQRLFDRANDGRQPELANPQDAAERWIGGIQQYRDGTVIDVLRQITI